MKQKSAANHLLVNPVDTLSENSSLFFSPPVRTKRSVDA